MKNKNAKAYIEFTFTTEEDLPLQNIVNNLRNLIFNHLNERLNLVSIDNCEVKKIKGINENKNINADVIKLLDAMDMNTTMLWTPDFQKKVEAIVLNNVIFEDDDGSRYNFDGISLEKQLLEQGLRKEKDFGEG